jgi:hypothetical protein
MCGSPHTDVVIGGTINPAARDHKPGRASLLFLSMHCCDIVHRIHVEPMALDRAEMQRIKAAFGAAVERAAHSKPCE